MPALVIQSQDTNEWINESQEAIECNSRHEYQIIECSKGKDLWNNINKNSF